MTINQRSIHAYAQGVSVAEEVLSSNPKTNCTWMDLGCDHGEVITLPRDALQMWQNEFYWLDGAVTLHENEGAADYIWGLTPVTWEDASEDIWNNDCRWLSSALRFDQGYW
ncbi:hypothetical protein N7467_008600 [Penicillium canescens]|nr:hypothetical protein N7467_008600 [Penicillium canescens]